MKGFIASIFMVCVLLVGMAAGVQHLIYARGFSVPSARGAEYVYYGYVPYMPGVLLRVAGVNLDVVGVNYSTKVSVYDLPTGREVGLRVINRMENYTLSIPFGTYFKVTSDKPVVASIASFGRFGHSFYPSTSGGFVGREFIFMARAPEEPETEYKIFAFEDAEVVIYDSAGRQAHRTKVSSYSIGRASLKPGAVYRVASTGRIMFSVWSRDGFTLSPSSTGGFIGRRFYGNLARAGVFIFFAHEESLVKAYEYNPLGVMAPRPTIERRLKPGEHYWERFRPPVSLFIESSGDISVLCGDTHVDNMEPRFVGDDISVIGVKADQKLNFYAPAEAVVFAPKDLKALIDGEEVSIPKDGFYVLGPGHHDLKANSTVILQIVGAGWGFPPVFNDFGSILPSLQDVEASYTVPEPPARDFAIYYALGGLGGAASLITLIMYRRYKKERG